MAIGTLGPSLIAFSRGGHREVTMSTLAWQPLTEADLPALTHLAGRCLSADGGLPLLATEAMLRRSSCPGGDRGSGRDRRHGGGGSVFVDDSGHRAATG